MDTRGDLHKSNVKALKLHECEGFQNQGPVREFVNSIFFFFFLTYGIVICEKHEGYTLWKKHMVYPMQENHFMWSPVSAISKYIIWLKKKKF